MDLRVNEVLVELAPNSSLQVSEDPLGCMVLARGGAGLVQTFNWVADSHHGELVEVLKPFSGCARPFYLLYPQNRYLSAKVQAVVDFLLPMPASGQLPRGI